MIAIHIPALVKKTHTHTYTTNEINDKIMTNNLTIRNSQVKNSTNARITEYIERDDNKRQT